MRFQPTMMLSIALASLTNIASSAPFDPLEGNLTKLWTEEMPFTSLQWAARLAADYYVFSADIEEFRVARAARKPDYLIWDSDACTWLIDKPMGYDFKICCERYDFGLYNMDYQGRLTDEVAKLKLERAIRHIFKMDMLGQCNKLKHRRGICRTWARSYSFTMTLPLFKPLYMRYDPPKRGFKAEFVPGSRSEW
ncbi:hypothetical protein IQ07DRAFT_650113 [Pyrenochaeta sp. DS3sAY3a]|nr:hypothetical protein IQ07DRAFT_650113 [Pyrenochaeta sp. DS3sAY3a]